MALLSLVFTPYSLLLIPLYAILYYVLPFFTTYRPYSKIPGPFVAKFSNVWLGLAARQGRKFEAVDLAHKKYGKFVRVGYNHVSIADGQALRVVYAHGNGFLKDHYYEAFVSGDTTGMFNTRDRVDHTRKRKIIAHAFSPKAITEFEPYMALNVSKWIAQLDRLSSDPTDGTYIKIDAMPWFSYLAFDIIGDLAFGKPFGMIEKGRDETEVQLVPGGPTSLAPAVDVLNRRGEISSTLGLLPAIRPWAKWMPDPFFSKGVEAVVNLNGIAIAAVSARLDASSADHVQETEPTRNDILQRLIDSKDESGMAMGRAEITAEALTQLIAGSDTISNTACAIFYWILAGERSRPSTVLPKLYTELDAITSTSVALPYSAVKSLPFLKSCIDEGMRLHSTSALGLPRIVVGQEVRFEDRCFPAGTVLSVPSFTIHHQRGVWGDDVEEFRPSRWEKLSERQRVSFNPFSYGPRACVGQNVAIMELQIILASVFRRFEFELCQHRLESHEGFSKKPKECYVGIRRRGTK